MFPLPTMISRKLYCSKTIFENKNFQTLTNSYSFAKQFLHSDRNNMYQFPIIIKLTLWPFIILGAWFVWTWWTCQSRPPDMCWGRLTYYSSLGGLSFQVLTLSREASFITWHLRRLFFREMLTRAPRHFWSH